MRVTRHGYVNHVSGNKFNRECVFPVKQPPSPIYVKRNRRRFFAEENERILGMYTQEVLLIYITCICKVDLTNARDWRRKNINACTYECESKRMPDHERFDSVSRISGWSSRNNTRGTMISNKVGVAEIIARIRGTRPRGVRRERFRRGSFSLGRLFFYFLKFHSSPHPLPKVSRSARDAESE